MMIGDTREITHIATSFLFQAESLERSFHLWLVFEQLSDGMISQRYVQMMSKLLR